MSKIIETLKAKSRELTSNGGQVKEFKTEKSGYELTQEQLADIYFSATGKAKIPEAPIIIKVVEKPRLASVAPWRIRMSSCGRFMLRHYSVIASAFSLR